MTEQLLEKLKDAIQKDFHSLYSKKYTATWKEKRLIRDIEIDIMPFTNTLREVMTNIDWSKIENPYNCELLAEAFDEGVTAAKKLVEESK